MEKKKKLSKLVLKKETISELNKKDLTDLKGGWTTTIGDCTHFACCCSMIGCGKSEGGGTTVVPNTVPGCGWGYD